MKRTVSLLLLALLFTACENWNLPVKDRMTFLSAMTPVNNWDELKNAVDSGAELIGVTTSFSTGNATISVERPLTIAAVPGARAVIARTGGFGNSFFEVNAGGDLILGHPSGGTLILDGAAVSGFSSLITISAGSCTMGDGAELRNNWNNGYGGAVYVTGSFGVAAFTMNGGTISGNEADGTAEGGGGVHVYGISNTAAFTMTGGTISGNKATDSNGHGGGACVNGYNAVFTMKGGAISGNEASCGGGVRVTNNADFTMNGGTISGNSTYIAGGGVYVVASTFKKEPEAGGNTSGIIYGSDGGENRNTANTSSAVHIDTSKQREATVGTNESLSALYNGGSYDFIGAWD